MVIVVHSELVAVRKVVAAGRMVPGRVPSPSMDEGAYVDKGPDQGNNLGKRGSAARRTAREDWPEGMDYKGHGTDMALAAKSMASAASLVRDKVPGGDHLVVVGGTH